jgi:hypothetical protein
MANKFAGWASRVGPLKTRISQETRQQLTPLPNSSKNDDEQRRIMLNQSLTSQELEHIKVSQVILEEEMVELRSGKMTSENCLLVSEGPRLC